MGPFQSRLCSSTFEVKTQRRHRGGGGAGGGGAVPACAWARRGHTRPSHRLWWRGGPSRPPLLTAGSQQRMHSAQRQRLLPRALCSLCDATRSSDRGLWNRLPSCAASQQNGSLARLRILCLLGPCARADACAVRRGDEGGGRDRRYAAVSRPPPVRPSRRLALSCGERCCSPPSVFWRAALLMRPSVRLAEARDLKTCGSGRLGVYDPLNLLAEPVEYPRRSYRRYVELEIKHGRIAVRTRAVPRALCLAPLVLVCGRLAAPSACAPPPRRVEAEEEWTAQARRACSPSCLRARLVLARATRHTAVSPSRLTHPSHSSHS
jgi:hypothetical protein